MGWGLFTRDFTFLSFNRNSRWKFWIWCLVDFKTVDCFRDGKVLLKSAESGASGVLLGEGLTLRLVRFESNTFCKINLSSYDYFW